MRCGRFSSRGAAKSQRLLAKEPALCVPEAFARGYQAAVARMEWDADRAATVGAAAELVQARLAEFPLARTRPFFDAVEGRQKSGGGLLSVTVNPEACKGCNLCVAVCPDGALVTVRQDDATLERLRRNWALWQRLPDTDDRFVNISERGRGHRRAVVAAAPKGTYRSMVGGDGACMGCGEKTAVHLVVSAIDAAMQPRVRRMVAQA